MRGELPRTLKVNGEDYQIRTDYRDVLRIFEAYADPELEHGEKCIIAIYLLFADFFCAEDVFTAAENGFDVSEAYEQVRWFLAAGQEIKKEEKPVYDWVKDEQMIFSAVNKVAGKETREEDYIHLWTFLGYMNEIGEGTFTFIVGIRKKINKKKKLEKHEREFYRDNKEMVDLELPKNREEREKEAEKKAILTEVLG